MVDGIESMIGIFRFFPLSVVYGFLLFLGEKGEMTARSFLYSAFLAIRMSSLPTVDAVCL